MNSAFQSILRFFQLPDLRRKFFIVLGLLVLTRVVTTIPLPGVDRLQLTEFLSNNQAFALLNVFTGGGLTNFSIAMMGVGPFITASIIFQLLTIVIPKLEQLSKEGEYGRRTINQYTRYAAIPLGFIQGYGTLTFLRNQGIISADWTVWYVLFMLIVAVAGTMLLLWIGELISEQGIGNGISMVITAGIISSFPAIAINTYNQYVGAPLPELLPLVGFGLIAALVLAVIIFINEGVRNIPVTYARRARGERTYGGVDTHLPIKVATAGVIPIIFAVSMILFPSVIAQFMEQAGNAQVASFGTSMTAFLANVWWKNGITFVLVIIFTFFYTSIVLQPKQIAENLQKQGGFVPGIRPGDDTEQHLGMVITRITTVGALFLAVITILPDIVSILTGVGSGSQGSGNALTLGGTSILITVAVVLEVMRQTRAQLITRTYDSYLR
jgi:preprotein translocase subunit SecY